MGHIFGGANADDAYGLTVDPNGNPIITEVTGSTGYISTDNTTLWFLFIDMYVSKFHTLHKHGVPIWVELGLER